MHTGPAVAGVIGIKKFIYDVWGDTVNTASRMESHGVPGRIQVTEATYQRLRDTFAFESRGLVDVKGKGPLPAYLLVGALEPEAAPKHSAAAPRPQPVEATDP
jgi:class 3 adenylate cyclase